MRYTFKDYFLKSLSESSFKELERKGTEPTSPEETQELLDLEIMEPTEADVWTMYRRDLIDKEERDRLLSPFRYQRKEAQRKKLEKQQQLRRWKNLSQKQIDMELVQNADPQEWIYYKMFNQSPQSYP
jgi:hypothetical protein